MGQYLGSLNDGRIVYCPGERAKDVRIHPTTRSLIGFSAMDCPLPNDLRFRPFFVMKNEEGKEVNLLFVAPRPPKTFCAEESVSLPGLFKQGQYVPFIPA